MSLLTGTVARVAPAYDVRIIATPIDEPSAELVAASADGWRIQTAVAVGDVAHVFLQRVHRRGDRG
jgi:hypothetical protein